MMVHWMVIAATIRVFEDGVFSISLSLDVNSLNFDWWPNSNMLLLILIVCHFVNLLICHYLLSLVEITKFQRCGRQSTFCVI